PDHRHHAVRRLRLDGELAVIDISQRWAGLARDPAGLGGDEPRYRSAAQFALAGPDAAAASLAPGGTLNRVEAVPGDVASRLRVRGRLVRHRLNGGTSSEIA